MPVQDMARERGDKRVEGEVFKWLGHAHNRLKDTAQAEKWVLASCPGSRAA